MKTRAISMLTVLVLAVAIAGCPGPQPVDAGTDTPSLDTPVAMDAPPDSPRFDVPFVDGRVPDVMVPDVPADVPADLPEPPVTCGWSIADNTFVCGGMDTMPPEAVCTGTNCCVEECAPGGTPTVCCDPVSGIILTYNYSAGMCPLDTTELCE